MYSQDDCVPCRKLKPKIREHATNLELRNIKDNPEKAREDGVRATPTVIKQNSDGEEIDRFVGDKDEGELKQWLNQL